jgi:uncharacterized coiled-coil DUF342 family protein
MKEKFGSVEWQYKKNAEIMAKIKKGEPLTSEECVYIQVQNEHNKRVV